MKQFKDLLENKSKVFLLKKYLYELKKILDNGIIDEYLLKNSLIKSDYDNCVCILKKNEGRE